MRADPEAATWRSAGMHRCLLARGEYVELTFQMTQIHILMASFNFCIKYKKSYTATHMQIFEVVLFSLQCFPWTF